AYGIGSLDDLASLVRSPIESFAHRLRGDALQQLGEDIARSSRSDDDPVALGFNVDPRSFAQTGPDRDVLGNAQPQAVAPSRDLHLAAQRLAQGLDPGDLVDRRADHREVEAVDRADIAVQHLAQMEGEIDRRNRLAGLGPCGAEPVETRYRLGGGVERPAANFL